MPKRIIYGFDPIPVNLVFSSLLSHPTSVKRIPTSRVSVESLVESELENRLLTVRRGRTFSEKRTENKWYVMSNRRTGNLKERTILFSTFLFVCFSVRFFNIKTGRSWMFVVTWFCWRNDSYFTLNSRTYSVIILILLRERTEILTQGEM